MMDLSDWYTEIIYHVWQGGRRLKLLVIAAGAVLWYGLITLFVFASLSVDRLLPIQLLMPKPATLSISVPMLAIGGGVVLWKYYLFFRARGSPVPFNPPRSMVIKGLYAHTRNPMMLGYFTLLFGLGVLLNSFSLFFIFAPVFILGNILYLKFIEEKEMEKKFGRQYLEYKRRVPMFVPGLRRGQKRR